MPKFKNIVETPPKKNYCWKYKDWTRIHWYGKNHSFERIIDIKKQNYYP